MQGAVLSSPSPPMTTLLSHRWMSTAAAKRGLVLTASATRTFIDPATAPGMISIIEKPKPDVTVDTPSAAYWDYQFLFLSQRSETHSPLQLPAVVGAVPTDFPHGTYYLTGPGLFSDDHGSTVHPLDGHGYLRAFDFGSDGDVSYSAKYIRTEAQQEESSSSGGGRAEEWRFSHRGPFSVLKGGRKFGNVKVMKNVANTSVVKWGGRLLCLWEGGDPYEVDHATLDTIGTLHLVNNHNNVVNDDRKEEHVVGARSLKDIALDMAAAALKPILHGNS